MSVWAEVIGQQPVVALFQSAALAARGAGRGMSHAWLLSGPPGSGRSIAARAFAAALQCQEADPGCGQCQACRTVLAGSHADVTVLRTEGIVITVAEVRALVALAQRRPSIGRWRVVIIEDADRLNDSSGNALLKALEEPTERTVWLLCAPSAQDVLITIRSRSRQLFLRTPAPDDVARLLVQRDGGDPTMASFAARAAQSHVGMARRLATDEQARIRRRTVVQLPCALRSVGEAVLQAGQLLAVATEEAEATSVERDQRERAQLLRALGADATSRTQPPHVRSQLAEMDKNHKRRAKRLVVDMLDHSLVDLLSVYRDVLVSHVDPGAELINAETRADVLTLAASLSPEQALQRMQVIRDARARLGTNAAPLLALEAMTLALRAEC